jgi:hypothetical protein
MLWGTAIVQKLQALSMIDARVSERLPIRQTVFIRTSSHSNQLLDSEVRGGQKFLEI